MKLLAYGIQNLELELKTHKQMFQRQRSRSKWQQLRITSSVIVIDIPIKPQELNWNFQPVVFELHATAFCCRDLDLGPMILKLNHDLDILEMYLHTENGVAR